MKRLGGIPHIFVLSLAAAAVLTWESPSADAAVTIGSDLAESPAQTQHCAQPAYSPCTVMNLATATGEPLASSINGVIVRWRVKARTSEASPARLLVIRNAGGGAFARISAGTIRAIAATAGSVVTYTFPERRPIATGELIGVDLLSASGGLQLAGPDVMGNHFARWTPPLDATPRAPADFTDGGEMLFNADVELDADGDGFGDETQDECPTDALTQQPCPGREPGPLLTLDLEAKKQKLKRKVKLFATADANSTLVARGKKTKTTTKQLVANQATKIKAKLKRKARDRLEEKLEDKGKAKIKVKATATTQSGAQATDEVKVKLKA